MGCAPQSGMKRLLILTLVLSGCAEPLVQQRQAELEESLAPSGVWVSGSTQFEIQPENEQGWRPFIYRVFQGAPYGIQTQEVLVSVEALPTGYVALRNRESGFCKVLVFTAAAAFLEATDAPRDSENCGTVVDFTKPWQRL